MDADAGNKTRKSATDWLRELPVVINRLAAARAMGIDPQRMSIYLARWEGAGLIQNSGSRTGIYFNLLKDAQAPENHRVDALLMTYPSATLIGESVLHAAGWITQVPRRLQVAVLSRRSYVAQDAVDVVGKPRGWFIHAHPFIQSPEDADASDHATYGLRALMPEHALAALYADPQAWHPDPDDLYLPDDTEQLEQALRHWECDEGIVARLLGDQGYSQRER